MPVLQLIQRGLGLIFAALVIEVDVGVGHDAKQPSLEVGSLFELVPGDKGFRKGLLD